MSGACEKPYKYYRVEVFAPEPGTAAVIPHKYRGRGALEEAMKCASQFPDGVSTHVFEVTERRVK